MIDDVKSRAPMCSPVILLQIVVVSPGTRLVKNHESCSPDPMSPKLKMLGPLRNQAVNLKTDSKVLY